MFGLVELLIIVAIGVVLPVGLFFLVKFIVDTSNRQP